MGAQSHVLPTLVSIKPYPCVIASYPTHSPKNRKVARKMLRHWKGGGSVFQKDGFVDCSLLIRDLGRKGLPHLAGDLLLEMKSEGLRPDNFTLSAMMLCYADNGLLLHAQALWEEMLNSSFVPNIHVVSELMDVYGKLGHFDNVIGVLDQVSSRSFNFLPEAYSVAISCLGKYGQLKLMEETLKRMVSKGFPIDYATGNAFIKYYSVFGTLTEMENAYGRLKRSRHLLDEEGIRAMSCAFIRERKLYRLGEFLKDVGLGRRNVGNLLWNLLLLSYAANFKMKSLQREFLRMINSGFYPDLTTFNIRALAFSRMSLFWDLHLCLEHMKHEGVVPDLVTYGCFVDAYIDRRLGRNLDFMLNKLNANDHVLVSTDPLVFEAFGKGEFQSSSEAFMEFRIRKKWTYRQLILVYLKKKFRENQIFWNV